MSKTVFHVDGGNSTGMVGQFSMGNEPSFHIPYLYNYCGAPWRTQQRTRFLLDLASDRTHPRKCKRPFAAGDLTAATGAVMAGILVTGALVLGLLTENPAFLGV